MAKSTLAVLAVPVVAAFLGVQAMGQTSGNQQPVIAASFAGSSLTCSQPPTERLIVPKAVEKRARLKAHLMNLLRESLYDDSKGIVDLAREKEIASLVNKLRKESPVQGSE
ncbi:MAG: hypothetical protein ACRD3L_02105 [Terriglobales bacterium]